MYRTGKIIALITLLLFSSEYFAQEDSNFTVVVDALYGKSKTVNSSSHKDYSILLSEKVSEIGKQSNLNVVLSRTHVQLNQIEQNTPTTKQHTDLLISLSFVKAKHQQTSMAIFYPTGGEFSKKSKQFGAHLSLTFAENNIMMHSFRMEPSNHFSLNESGCPSILIEFGYIGNTDEDTPILSDVNQYAIAEAIIESIETVVGP